MDTPIGVRIIRDKIVRVSVMSLQRESEVRNCRIKLQLESKENI